MKGVCRQSGGCVRDSARGTRAADVVVSSAQRVLSSWTHDGCRGRKRTLGCPAAAHTSAVVGPRFVVDVLARIVVLLIFKLLLLRGLVLAIGRIHADPQPPPRLLFRRRHVMQRQSLFAMCWLVVVVLWIADLFKVGVNVRSISPKVDCNRGGSVHRPVVGVTWPGAGVKEDCSRWRSKYKYWRRRLSRVDDVTPSHGTHDAAPRQGAGEFTPTILPHILSRRLCPGSIQYTFREMEIIIKPKNTQRERVIHKRKRYTFVVTSRIENDARR